MSEEKKCAVFLNPQTIDLFSKAKFNIKNFLEDDMAILCHGASNDGVFVKMAITHPGVSGDLELQVPHRFVLAILSGKNVKSLGFQAP